MALYVTITFAVGLALAVAALVFALIKKKFIYSFDQGTDLMREIAKATQDGAMAFLKREYTYLVVFVVAVVILLAIFLDVLTAACFVCGALASATAGFIGMRVSTRSAVRTTEAARTSLLKALSVAFSSGTVMGFTVVGLGVGGIAVLGLILVNVLEEGKNWIEPIFGFSFGASSIALFARVGG
ncbi:MAG: sodium/proton-translocating pyrophosphatase, partial [Planctomycetes bacterium]|nr:sodium/proton-translocating pyrophosphatase [Planctomycetota bacterium]